MTEPLTTIHNFRAISETLATAGQPTAEQLAAIASAGYGVVINLALPTSDRALPNEEAIVTGLGMDYVAIPVVWEEPTLADLAQFFQIWIPMGNAVFLCTARPICGFRPLSTYIGGCGWVLRRRSP